MSASVTAGISADNLTRITFPSGGPSLSFSGIVEDNSFFRPDDSQTYWIELAYMTPVLFNTGANSPAPVDLELWCNVPQNGSYDLRTLSQSQTLGFLTYSGTTVGGQDKYVVAHALPFRVSTQWLKGATWYFALKPSVGTFAGTVGVSQPYVVDCVAYKDA